MIIYFEDGELLRQETIPVQIDFKVDAKKGYTDNCNTLDNILEFNPNAIVYTNSLVALNNKYAWNKALSVSEVYIRDGEHMIFTRIDYLTGKEIRECHNIMMMYMNGAFLSNSREGHIYNRIHIVPTKEI